MKKLLRIEDILVSFISAIGSGIGYAIPKPFYRHAPFMQQPARYYSQPFGL